MSFQKNLLKTLAIIGALCMGASGCNRNQDQSAEKKVVQSSRSLLPSGAGVLLADKKIVLVPQENENKIQYEKRLSELNHIAPQVGYQFVTILTPENKAAYDGFMMTFYAEQGRVYNMVLNPISSWVSLQMATGVGNTVAHYTPHDIRQAQVSHKYQERD